MIRIYLRHISELLSSDCKSRTFLSYLKIRNASKGRCGGFNLQNLTESLGVSEKSSRKALNKLIEHGYVIETKRGHYRIVAQTKLFDKHNHERFFKITSEEINSYSWRNISHFRAMLVELENQKNRNLRRYLRKGFTVVDRHGVKEVKKVHSNQECDTLMASTYVSTYIKRTPSTILRYRTKQKLVTYSKREIIPVKVIAPAKEDKTYYLPETYMDRYGKYFENKGKLIFVPCSTRLGRVIINGY